MTKFVMGMLVGIVLSSSLGLADGLYDRQGKPAAPRGSVQQFDYYRDRQQQLDVGAIRQQADRQGAEGKSGKPCP